MTSTQLGRAWRRAFMHVRSLCARHTCFAFIVLLSGALTPAVAAQSAEDLELLRQLPADQQQAVLEAYLQQQNGDGSSTATGQSTGARTVTDEQRGRAPQPGAADARMVFVEPKIPVLGANSTVLVDVSAADTGAPTLENARAQIQNGNPYRLDRTGNLLLPGFAPIALGGLDEAQANRRLRSEPQLRGLTLSVALMPVKPPPEEALRPFGYDIFDGAASNFVPSSDIPVPSDYVLAPGDSLRVNLVGNQNRRLTLDIDRNGDINFPELGPITLAGIRFEEAKTLIEQQVSEQMIGVRANVTMGNLRAQQVFILGEVKQPGSYTVSSLSTITNALFASGGITPIGSLRKVQLKRNGATVANLDLYDLLLRGDTRNDARVLSGDVIFIPSLGPTVSVSGAVRRPAIYEVTGERSASDLIALAGGLLPDADGAKAVIARINERRDRVVIDVDLSTRTGLGMTVQSADLLQVPYVRPNLAQAILVLGHVYRPGPAGFRAGMRLTDALPTIDELKPNADQRYVLIRRELPPDRKIAVFSADLAAAWADRRGSADIPLQARDRIVVFDLTTDRSPVVGPLLDELRRQSTASDPTSVVSVYGQVKAPGRYPLEPGMRIDDLLRAGGGLDDAAYTATAELARYEVIGGERRETELITIDLQAIRNGQNEANVELRPFDYLSIREVPEWAELESVSLVGEVRFPGSYPIKRGETLGSVIQRAGGLTDLAFAEGSVFTRATLREREQQQLEDLAERMRRDLATLALQASGAAASTGNNNPQALAVGESLLSQASSAKAIGRLVINLDKVVNGPVDGPDDVRLRHGDELIVPRQSQAVTVIGEVQNATSHLYDAERNRNDYIEQSGGMTRNADDSRIYIIRANGSVDAQTSSLWFRRAKGTDIRPGDTIVVPLDTERTLPLPLWTSVTQILYNIAVAVAAVNSF